MQQPTVRQLPQARETFVPGPVVAKVEPLEVLAALPAKAELGEVELRVLPWTPAGEHEGVALHATSGVDEAGGFRPTGRVERHVVQGFQDAVVQVLLTHPLTLAPQVELSIPPKLGGAREGTTEPVVDTCLLVLDRLEAG